MSATLTATTTLADLLAVSPMLALFFASLVPITVKVFKGNIEQTPMATLIQGLGGIISSAILLLIIYLLMSSNPNPTAFSDSIVIDGMTVSVGLLMLFVGAGALLLMYDHPATNGSQFSELIFLTLNCMVGMMILLSAVDLLIIFIGLEMMSLCLYLMIGMSHEQRLSKEAALKYFILGSLASAIFLYGVSFIFGTVGSTSLPVIIESTQKLAAESRLFLFGMTLALVGFCFKVSIAPFHAWTPDVYQGAPTPHTALMATAVKAVSFAAFLRFISSQVLMDSQNLFEIMQWIAVITMFVGNVAALLQKSFKRMLAYSSIAHSGYLLVGVIATGISEELSFAGSGIVFYLVAYSIMTLGAFAAINLMEKSEDADTQIQDFAGLAARRPLLAASLTVLMLSLAGIPPTLGFFGKFYLFSAAIGEGLLWLALWGVLNSVISVYYYLRPIVVMYMESGTVEDAGQEWIASRITLVSAAVLIVLLGLMSGPLFSTIERLFS